MTDRNPQFDGLRALAALVVVFVHCRVPGFAWGYLGVDAFFVLSGFLITGLLVSRPQPILRFYARRAIRLYPALVAMVALTFALSPLYPAPPTQPVSDALIALLYLSDIARPLLGRPQYMEHTWSLSIEEHFYLLWPLLLPLLLRSRHRPWLVLLAAYLVLTAWRMYSWRVLGWQATYFRFDTHVSGIVLGALIALKPPPARAAWAMAFGGFVLAALLFEDHALGVYVTAFEVACAGVVLLASRHRLGMLASKPLAWLGLRSYGIYLYHFPLLWIFRGKMSWLPLTATICAGSIVLAAASFATIERWAMSRRERVLERIGKPSAETA